MGYVKIIAELSKERAVSDAVYYSNSGADEVAWMDLDADRENRETDIALLKEIVRAAEIPVIACGGVKRMEDVKKMLYAGASMVYLQEAARKDVQFVREMADRFGSDKIGVVVDLKAEDVLSFAKQCEQMGAGGLYLAGFDDGLQERVREVKKDISIPVMVSVRQEGQLLDVIRETDAEAVLYNGEGLLEVTGSKAELKKNGITVNTFESALEFDTFKLDDKGLIPCITQDYKTGEVLMMAYMNRESYYKTLETGKMTYFSRSRQKLWMKGEESGHLQYVKELIIDCDRDTILAKVSQIGVACHTGNPTCFFTPLAKKEYDDTNPLTVFNQVYEVIADRKLHPKEGSYTNYLFDKGIDKILKKVGEECTEIVIAAKNPDPEEIKYEISDFLYHCMVLMVERGVTWEDITRELDNRH